MFTAWDGYARVDYLPVPGRIQVTLLTVEPTVRRRVRPGLTCAFAADDAAGPPTFVEMDIGFGLTEDEKVLLGALAVPVGELMGGERGSRTARLALDEVAAYAETWTPYRAAALAEQQSQEPARTGAWGRGLWALLGQLGLVAAVSAHPAGREPAFRSDQGAEDDEWQEFELPSDLATAAGVERRISWTTYRRRDEEGGVEQAGVLVLVYQAGEGPPDLAVGFDGGGWTGFAPHHAVASAWYAALPLSADADEPALRFRTDRGTDG